MSGRERGLWAGAGQRSAPAAPARDEERLFQATLILSPRALGLLLGLFSGAALFLATNWLVLKGGPQGADGDPLVGPHLALLGQYFLGYRVTFLGSLVGLVWAFVLGALTGGLVATIYNRLAAGRGPA